MFSGTRFGSLHCPVYVFDLPTKLGSNSFCVAFDCYLLDAFSRHGVILKNIQPAGNLEDAFLKTLAEDRRRGFARAFEIEDLSGHFSSNTASSEPEREAITSDKSSTDEVT